jgi:hypothetical protein
MGMESASTLAKCANVSCGVGFNPYAGGRFSCFPQGAGDSETLNVHGVKHYWLCEQCSRRYVLVYTATAQPEQRVSLLAKPAVEPAPRRRRVSTAA